MVYFNFGNRGEKPVGQALYSPYTLVHYCVRPVGYGVHIRGLQAISQHPVSYHTGSIWQLSSNLGEQPGCSSKPNWREVILFIL